MTVRATIANRVGAAAHAISIRRFRSDSRAGVRAFGRLGLAGRAGFYAILTGLTIRIALLGGTSNHQANANGALVLVSRPLLGKVAIGAVAVGFVLFGIGRLVGAYEDRSVSNLRRWMTVVQGLFYLALGYVPASYLAGNQETGSQQQQQKDTARLLDLPAGRWIVAILGAVLVVICAAQIRGAVRRDFSDGLDLEHAPRWVRRVVGTAGVVGITARSLVFLPIGFFLIVAAVEFNPKDSYGTDSELLRLAAYPWGIAILAVVSAGLAVFVVFSCIEARYRRIISAR